MASTLFVRSEPGIVFVGIEGHLDENAVEALVDAAKTAAGSAMRHICLDLDGVSEWSPRAMAGVNRARQAVIERRGSVLLRADTYPARAVLGEVGLNQAA